MTMRSLAAGVLMVLMLVAGAAHAVLGDVKFQREEGGGDAAGSTPPAVFPHWKHRIQYKCYVCHPAIFQMKAGANDITMEQILAGKFCGTCHNGKQAWAVGFDTCPKCHVDE